MSLKRSLLTCAALAVAVHLPAAEPAKPATTKEKSAATTKKGGTAKKSSPEDLEAAKARKAAAEEEKKKNHVVAAMELEFGRDSGEVLIELFPEDAPRTVENFRQLAGKGFYNGLAVHRAVKDYLVQMGDTASRDDKARETWGLTQESTLPAEIKRGHTVGAVAMARRGDKVNSERRSDGSQFYIALGNLSSLDGQYTVFGQVVSGMSVLKRISRLVTDSNDCPVVRVEIKKLKVVEQTGPLVTMTKTPSGRHQMTARPDALKGPIERFLERIW